MFDTHCHLFDKAYIGTLDSLITSSRDAGVLNFLIPAVNVETSKEAIKISKLYQNTYCAVGIHPTEKLESVNLESDEAFLSEACLEQKVVAIGECGLDYYHFKSSPDVQKKYLLMHLKLALKYEKALILHNRQSTKDVLEILINNWQETLRGKIVFHCASFEDELIDFAKKFDCYLGVDGDITYDQFKQKRIHNLPLQSLLLETDSPYLLPEPLKSQKKYPNTPANLGITADFVAKLMSIDKKSLIEQTTKNAKNVFGLK